MGDSTEMPAVPQPDRPSGRWTVPALHLSFVMLVATGLRLWGLGSTSLWFDEVVTMRVARTSGPASLVERLDQIDGTRAPLHPLVLHVWLRIFGPSDWSGRSFSALCGIATVAVIYQLGRAAFDEMTGRWAATLAAVCPPLVYYSQEARMYAWLVLLTSVSWLVFLSFRRAAKPGGCLAYWLLLTALVYSHPLGLFMVAAHGLCFLLVRPYLKLTLRWWLLLQAAVILSIVPWLGRYMDHGTDYPMPRQPIRFLLAVPIEYVGGNSVVLLVCVAVIAFGLLARERWPRLAISHPAENVTFITWAAVPPVLMYVYSYLSQPIFGPPRYHLSIAPAYLILLGHGLCRLPAPIRWPLAAASLTLSLLLLQHYQQALKADWRSLAAALLKEEADERGAGDPLPRPTIVVHPSDPRFPREQVEAARNYLIPQFRVLPADDLPASAELSTPIYDVHCLSQPANPDETHSDLGAFYGLRVLRRKATGR